MRNFLIFLLLLGIKGLSKLFYRHDVEWVDPPPDDPWSDVRVIALLHHTSLYEPIFAAAAPNRLLREVAYHGVVPVARKTAARPLVGTFFRLVASHVIPITRERDHTWEEVCRRIRDPRAVLVILPEGRMMRRTGLDAHGNPMTVRGGIGDILRTVAGGRMLLAYSGGLHHVHAPGDRYPRLFRRVRLRLEVLEIEPYRRELFRTAGEEGFKAAVVNDLTRRRDRHSPVHGAAGAAA